MAASSSPTFSPPENVTIPGEVALEALALLNAFANLLAGFRLELDAEPFYVIEQPVWQSLMTALGHDLDQDIAGPLFEAYFARGVELQKVISSHLGWPAEAALATTTLVHDVTEEKALRELIGRG
jgi:hypothetical protein